MGSASRPMAKVVRNADSVSSYASHPMITCCNQKAPLENAVAPHMSR